MKQLNQLIPNPTINQIEPNSDTAKKVWQMLATFKQASKTVCEKGINALELIPSDPIKAESLTKAKYFLEQNYGTEYSAEKWLMLVDEMIADHWSEERFQRTFRWFIRNKPFPAWNIADWFDYSVKLYPYAWYVARMNELGNRKRANDQFDVYRLPNGATAWKWKDGIELPFDKIEIPNK